MNAPNDIETLKARLREAMAGVTAGPWQHYCAPLRKGMATINEVQDGRRRAIVQWGGFDNSDRTKKTHRHNAAYIALCSPDNIGSLLTALDQKDAHTQELEGALREVISKDRTGYSRMALANVARATLASLPKEGADAD